MLAISVTISGCETFDLSPNGMGSSPQAAPSQSVDVQAAPVAAAAPLPLAKSTSAEDFDTTTASQRQRAAGGSGGGRQLGSTIASLGSPSEPGFWLKTPLVAQETAGSVRSKNTGDPVAVTLIPIDGPPTAGSRLSLPAMRLLGVPLTTLVELEVSAQG